MKIIKLNATNSTNSFLKELAKNSDLKNFTVVVTNQQTKGRGQQENSWHSKPFKNLTFSVFSKFKNLDISNQKYLNFAISLAIFEVLNKYNLPKPAIKWPNDILSANKKIAGILVENAIKGTKIKYSILGIGININQTNFVEVNAKVTSLKNETQKDYNLDLVLNEVIVKIEEKMAFINDEKFQLLEKEYLTYLYKKNIPTLFKDRNNVLFMGCIIGVSKEGNLQILVEDAVVKTFGIKEVSFA